MNKFKLLTLTLFTMLSLASTYSHARGPSVDPMTEVDIETEKSKLPPKGYNFNEAQVDNAESAPRSRTPANIVTHQKNTSPTAYLLPFLILMSIPFGIWFLMSRKEIETKSEIDFLSDVEAVKPDEDDDVNFPKAS